MKTAVKITVASLIGAPLLILGNAAAAVAQTAPAASSTSDQSAQTTMAPADKVALQQRLQQRVAQLKLKLTAADQKLITARCKPAQAIIKNLSDRVNANVPVRTNAYKELDDHLNTLIPKLTDKGVDTTELKNEQTALDAKIAKFKTDVAAYQQALSDLNAMDCVADPAAFKASLEAARQLRPGLSQEITDIRAYVTGTIKPTLVTIRAQVAASSKTGGNQ